MNHVLHVLAHRLAVLMLGASSVFAFNAPVSAAPEPQAGPLPPALPGPHAAISFQSSIPMAPQAPSRLSPSTIPGWSRLVFQSYRDGNWEIYRAAASGGDQTRVTHDPGVDYAPRLSPGANRIAFASNRNGGDYDIFVVDWDGSGLAALTTNGDHDVAPAWSPNGNQLAFESYRDGQAEIYLMNANGSGQARLTNHSAYDGTPVWSPDGTKIAFTSRRTGSYQVWVMNADGSNPRALTNFANAYDPAWSPDGSQIAFDADADDDNFEELWLMDADGAAQRLVYNPPLNNQVAWARSWSVDGRYVAFSRITFEGAIATESLIMAWDSFNSSGVFPLSPGDRDTNPDWQPTPDPDLWVAQSHHAGLPGKQIELVLTYGNRGAATARNVRVTEQLPAGLTFVSADPPPSATSPALRWTKSSLPASNNQTVIRITVQVDENASSGSALALNAAIVSDTSEPDLDNNLAEATFFVGWQGYQPFVLR